jgi:endonuclease/exonuclease/phosphatase (EEP) superfamily protein YafD
MVARTAWWTVSWIAVVPMVVLALTQVVGVTSSRVLAVLHALTPYLLLPAVPLAVLALWKQQWALGVCAAAVAIVIVALGRPLALPPDQPAAADGALPLRIVHSNVLYENRRLEEAVDLLLSSDADVIVVTEYSDRVHAAFVASSLSPRFPHHVGHTAGTVGGTGIWSRHVLVERPSHTTKFSTAVVDVRRPGQSTVRVVGVHVPSPIHDFDMWHDELIALDCYAASDLPTVVAGDFNASWWHPGFRDLLEVGFGDAHRMHGAGLSASWPADRLFPPFVRLDHALVTEQLVVDAIDDFDVPGSDHRGFEVTLRRAADR